MFVLFIIFQENHTPQVINVYDTTTKFIADETFLTFPSLLSTMEKEEIQDILRSTQHAQCFEWFHLYDTCLFLEVSQLCQLCNFQHTHKRKSDTKFSVYL
jgi:hypothetical protein